MCRLRVVCAFFMKFELLAGLLKEKWDRFIEFCVTKKIKMKPNPKKVAKSFFIRTKNLAFMILV